MTLLRSLLIVMALFALACGAETPVPDYPFPEQPPLEETELAEYVGAGDEEPVEEEEWDDGLDEEMGSLDGEPSDAAESEGAPTP